LLKGSSFELLHVNVVVITLISFIRFTVINNFEPIPVGSGLLGST
jgi:hypothetical protein